MADNEVKLRITSDATGAIAGMGKAGDALRKLERDSQGVMGAISRHWQGFAALTAGIGFTALARSALESMDSIAKMSQKVGIGAETLQTFSYAAKLSGTDLDGISTALGRFSRNIVDVQRGTGAAGDIFRALGISVKDSGGSIKSTDILLGEVADRFQKMRDGAGKTGMAMELFGKSGKEMIPFLNEGSAGLADMRKEAEALGLILDSSTIKQAERVQDNLERLEMAAKGLIARIVGDMLPALETLTGAFVDLRKETDPMRDVGEDIGSGLLFVGRVMATLAGLAYSLAGAFKLAEAKINDFAEAGKKISKGDIAEGMQQALGIEGRTTYRVDIPTGKITEQGAPSERAKALDKELRSYMKTAERMFDLADQLSMGPPVRLARAARSGAAPDVVDTDKQQKALEAYGKTLDDFIRSVDEMDPAMGELDKQLSRFNARADDLFAKANELKQPVNDIIAAVYRGREFLSAADLDKRATAASEAWGKAFLEFRDIQEEITNKELSEIDRRMAAEDKWAQNITEKLGTRWTPELGDRIKKITDDAKAEITRSKAREELEAETRRQLAAVQVSGEQYLMPRAAVTEQTITLNQRLLDQYKEDLAVTQDAAAKLTLEDKIADLNLELMRSDYLLKQLTGTFGEGWARGIARYLSDMETAFESGEDLARVTSASMEENILDFLDSASDGFLDFERLVTNVLQDIQRELLRTLVVKPIVGGISGGLSDLLGLGLSVAGGFMGGAAGTGVSPELMEMGAAEEAAWAGFPRYQHGGDYPAHQPFIAGEHGYPELIIPENAGTVVPAGKWGNTLSITVPVAIGPEHKRLASQIQQAVEREVARIAREYT